MVHKCPTLFPTKLWFREVAAYKVAGIDQSYSTRTRIPEDNWQMIETYGGVPKWGYPQSSSILIKFSLIDL